MQASLRPGDPYSCYYTAEQYEQTNSSTEGSYVGIGVTIQENPEGGVKIAECYEEVPAIRRGWKWAMCSARLTEQILQKKKRLKW